MLTEHVRELRRKSQLGLWAGLFCVILVLNMSVDGSTAGLSFATLLRRELCGRGQKYAETRGLRHQLSYGAVPVVVFDPGVENQHGNFLPSTYAAILRNPGWRKRLRKHHSQARSSLPPRENGRWRELDSCNSSDALLMNVFCYPGLFADGRVHALLGVEPGAKPEFGFRARVPLTNGKFDRTEVDMRLGNLLLEAKLTEADFQRQSRKVLEGYRDFTAVFEVEALPQTDGEFLSYQLIRNVLAAHATGGSFCVLCDARRPDLLEAWYRVMRCVQVHDLRLRCKALTWQELAMMAPKTLRKFLEEKYGIV